MKIKSVLFPAVLLAMFFTMFLTACQNPYNEAALGLVGEAVSSSDENIITAVIENGDIVLTVIKKGTAEITVTDSEGNEKKIPITVTEEGTAEIIVTDSEGNEKKISVRVTEDGEIINVMKNVYDSLNVMWMGMAGLFIFAIFVMLMVMGLKFFMRKRGASKT